MTAEDPYLDPATGLLRNRVGATTVAELAARETDLSEARAIVLAEEPVAVTGDLRHLQAIHHGLFQDVYDWAGQIRTVDIAKDVEGGEFFMPVSRIATGAAFVFGELADERLLADLDRDRFVRRLAHHYDQVNYLHPFREGNGRTQRLFWSQIAEQAGFALEWRNASGAENDQASRIASEQRNLAPLITMLDRVVVTELARDAGSTAVRLARLNYSASARYATGIAPDLRVGDYRGRARPLSEDGDATN